MNSNIYSTTPDRIVIHHTSVPTYINSSSNHSGQVGVNAQGQLQVWDGNSWITISSNTTIGLSSSTEQVLRWAEQKMREEQALLELAKTNPGIKSLLAQKIKIEEKIKVLQILDT